MIEEDLFELEELVVWSHVSFEPRFTKKKLEAARFGPLETGALIDMHNIDRIGVFGIMEWKRDEPHCFCIQKVEQEAHEEATDKVTNVEYDVIAVSFKTGQRENLVRFALEEEQVIEEEGEFAKYGLVFPYLVVENSYLKNHYGSLIEFKIINLVKRTVIKVTSGETPDPLRSGEFVWIGNLGKIGQHLFVHDKLTYHLYRLPISGSPQDRVVVDTILDNSCYRIFKDRLYGYQLKTGRFCRVHPQTFSIESSLNLLKGEFDHSYVEMMATKSKLLLAVYCTKKRSAKWIRAHLILTDTKLKTEIHRINLDGILRVDNSDVIKLSNKHMIGLAGCVKGTKGRRDYLVLFGVVVNKIHTFKVRWDQEEGFPLSQLIGYPVGYLFFEHSPSEEHQFHWRRIIL